MRRAWRRPSWPVVLWCCARALFGCVAVLGLGCGPAVAQEAAPTQAVAPGPDWVAIGQGVVVVLAGLGVTGGAGVTMVRRRNQAVAEQGQSGPTVEERVAVLERSAAVLEERSTTERHESRKMRQKLHKIGNVVFAMAHQVGIDPDEVEDSDEDEPETEKAT